MRFRFPARASLGVRDRRIAKIIKACQELPGQELLQFVDEAGNCQDVTSTDVNDHAGTLGNTSTICRKCYVHSEVLNSYMDGNLVLELKSKVEGELRSDF